MLEKSFIKFCDQVKNCGKPEVVFLFSKQRYDSRSTFGRNYKNILLHKRKLTNYTIPENEEWKIKIIKDLIEVIENKAIIEHLSTEDVKAMLADIACT